LLRATIVGRFFSGDQKSGCRHFGLFSLIAIQQILAVESSDPKELEKGQ
jgi:hypothetical protein